MLTGIEKVEAEQERKRRKVAELFLSGSLDYDCDLENIKFLADFLRWLDLKKQR